jgi:hypothetical protein
MRAASTVIAIVLAVHAAAAGSRSYDDLAGHLEKLVEGPGPGGQRLDDDPPRFAFTPGGAAISPSKLADAESPIGDDTMASKTVGGTASDGKAAWVATDIEYPHMCGAMGCEKMTNPAGHAVALFDADEHAVAWSVDVVVAGTFSGDPVPGGAKVVLDTKVDRGAEQAVAVFKAALADPDALAKTIASRDDVVLFGSELDERYVGAAAVRATLKRWRLSFTVRDGIQAGVTPSKTTAWVAATVNAAKKGDKTPTHYRVFAIYDKQATSWQLVLLQFSSMNLL